MVDRPAAFDMFIIIVKSRFFNPYLLVTPMSALKMSFSCLYSVFSLPAIPPEAGLNVPSTVTYTRMFVISKIAGFILVP